jgi:hypothetical protein
MPQIRSVDEVTHIAADIKYLAELCLLLRQRRRAAKQQHEKGRDSTRRHVERKYKTSWACVEKLIEENERS